MGNKSSAVLRSGDKYLDDAHDPPPSVIEAWSEDDMVRRVALACAEGDVALLRQLVESRGKSVLELRDPSTVNAGPLPQIPIKQSYVVRMSYAKREAISLPRASQARPAHVSNASFSSSASSSAPPSLLEAPLPSHHTQPGALVLHTAAMTGETKAALRAARDAKKNEDHVAAKATQSSGDASPVVTARSSSSPFPVEGSLAGRSVPTVALSAIVVDDIPTTPLIAACRHGQKDVVNFLVEHGADVDEVWAQTNPLIEAVRHEYAVISRLLLFRQASVVANADSDAATNGPYSDLDRLLPSCCSALHVCVELGNREILETMLGECNGVIDFIRPSDGFTPLHVAVDVGNIFAVKQLVEHGADLELVNDFGQTALALAVDLRRTEIAALLQLSGLGGPRARAKRRREKGCSCLCL
jgi:hypothetical protein